MVGQTPLQRLRALSGRDGFKYLLQYQPELAINTVTSLAIEVCGLGLPIGRLTDIVLSLNMTFEERACVNFICWMPRHFRPYFQNLVDTGKPILDQEIERPSGSPILFRFAAVPWFYYHIFVQQKQHQHLFLVVVLTLRVQGLLEASVRQSPDGVAQTVSP